MKKMILRTLLSALCPLLLVAQAPDTLWTRTYGGPYWDRSYHVEQTSDSGYIMVGETFSYGAGERDVYLIKTDVNGDTLWTKTYGTPLDDWGASVKQTLDGGYIIVGTKQSNQIYVIKTDSNGDSIWTIAQGLALGYSVVENPDSSYAITGQKIWNDNWHKFVMKVDQDGNIIWLNDSLVMGVGREIKRTPDGGYIIAGYWSPWNGDFIITKTDSHGRLEWSRAYGPTNVEVAMSVENTVEENGYVITGYTQSAVCIMKLNEIGDSLWARTYVGGRGNSIKRTRDNGYIVTGWSASENILLIKTDASGVAIWIEQIWPVTDIDRGMSVCLTNDGGYAISGYTSRGYGYWDFFLIKIATDTLGIIEQFEKPFNDDHLGTSIFSGPLLLPAGRNCKVFDVTGRVVLPDKIKPGVYFIEIDGKIKQKVIKVQ